MHESMTRLLGYARDKTQGRADAIRDFADLGEALGVTSAVLTNWKRRGISKQGALEAERRWGCSATWVLDGAGPVEGKSSNDESVKPPVPAGAIPVDPSRFKRIWVVGRGAGGMPARIWTDGDYPVGATEEYGDVLSADPQAFLAEVIEDSMIPVFNPRNFALVEPNTPVDLEDRVLVRLADGKTLIKRLLSQRNGYTFGSYNDPKQLHFTAEEVTWIYYIAFEVPRKKIKARV